MAEELADIQNEENASQGVTTPDVIGSEPSKAEKPLSIRESIQAAVKTETEKERLRDEKGKFTAPEKVAAEKPAKAEASVQTEAKAESKPSAPPPGWSQASKDYFNSLPADHPLRQDVDKRELEVSKGFKDYSDKTKQYQEIEQVLAPFRPVYQQYGVKSDAEATKRLFEWEASLRANPAQGIARLAQQFGIDLKQFAQESPAQVETPEHLRPVLDEVGQIKQQLRAISDAQTQEQQNKVATELSSFAKDHPHFETVRSAMGHLMNSGLAKDLKDAYDQAVWANPSLRDQILAEREEKQKADFAKAQAEAAKNARLAAVSPPPRARQGAPNGADKGAKNVRGSILNAINSLREDTRA